MKNRALLILSMFAIAVSACTKKSDSAQAPAAAAPAPVTAPESAKAEADKDAATKKSEAAKREAEAALQANENEAAGINFEDYLPASDDYLRAYLESKIESEKSTVQARAIKKAQLIKNAALKVNGRSVTATFEFFADAKFNNRNAGRKLSVSGTMNEDGEASLKSQHSQFSGKLECLDDSIQANACEARLVRLNFDGSPVYVVFRQTSATFHVKFPEMSSPDVGMTKLLRLFKLAEFNVDSRDALKEIDVQTVEVARGISKMQVILQSQSNEIVMMKFALLKLDGHRSSAKVDRTYQPEEIRHLTKGAPVLNTIAAAISNIQLIENDGRGNVTLNLNMKILDRKKLSPVELSLRRVMNKAAY